MDCHRCEHVRYDGCPYGRCSHPGHPDVRMRGGKSRLEGEPRPYNRQICPDFSMKRRCSNCAYWRRGEYFRDGRTPARKGECSLKVKGRCGKDCPVWRIGPTSWSRERRST